MPLNIINLKNSTIKIRQVVDFLKNLDDDFAPPFHTRVDSFRPFIIKVIEFGQFLLSCDNNKIAGVIGFYCNDHVTHKGYITYLGVKKVYREQGVAASLLLACLDQMKVEGMRSATVTTDDTNSQAIKFYLRHGFKNLEKEGNRSIPDKKILFEHLL